MTNMTRPQGEVRSPLPGLPAEPISVAASSFMHLARWFSTLLVLMCHLSMAIVSVPDIMSAPHGPFAYAWWFVTAFGFAHEGLVVFFVLSGFLVGGRVFQRRGDTQPWLGAYVIDRLVRIYVVLVPALALTLVCDALGRHFFPDPTTYGLEHFAGRYDLALLVPNLLSLQGLWFRSFGSNDPLWSLGLEVWFYLLFPLLLLPWLRAYPNRWLRVGGLAFAIVFLTALPLGFIHLGFCLWGTGVVARCLPAPLVRNRWVALAPFLIVSVVLRLAVRPPLSTSFPTQIFVDGAAALLFANLLLTLRFDLSGGFRFVRLDIHRRLAGFSFTLYAIHWPLLFLMLSAIGTYAGTEWRKQPATPLHYATAIGIAVVIIFVARTFSSLTEGRTDVVRRAVRRRLRPMATRRPDERLSPP